MQIGHVQVIIKAYGIILFATNWISTAHFKYSFTHFFRRFIYFKLYERFLQFLLNVLCIFYVDLRDYKLVGTYLQYLIHLYVDRVIIYFKKCTCRTTNISQIKLVIFKKNICMISRNTFIENNYLIGRMSSNLCSCSRYFKT